MLSDRDISDAINSGRISIDPFDPSSLQPNSYDVHCGNLFRVFGDRTDYPATMVIDPTQPQEDLTRLEKVPKGSSLLLYPGQFLLGVVEERMSLSAAYAARLEGKSSLGRLGLVIHSTAGFVDAGYYGKLTLELSCVAPLPIRIYPGMKIGQVAFFELKNPARRPYSPKRGSKYQGDTEPVGSKMHLDF